MMLGVPVINISDEVRVKIKREVTKSYVSWFENEAKRMDYLRREWWI
jgi:hypothetical protein